MEGTIVSKFGGSSITGAGSAGRIKNILSGNPSRKIVVVSAPGISGSYEKKVTDMLLELPGKSSPYEVMERLQALAPDSDLGELESILKERLGSPLKGREYMDNLVSFGEEACARIMASELGAEYVDPSEILLVARGREGASIKPESWGLVREAFAGRGLSVVPGFFGFTSEGLRAVFSRGGSDLTGAYIAAALDADIYENFTDVNGVMAASPKIVKDPVKIREMTFDELRDLSYSGFGVFHDEAVEPLLNSSTPVHVRSTFDYPSEGTFIVNDRVSDPGRPIAGVAYKGGFCSFDVSVFGLNRMVGVGKGLLEIFESRGVSVEYITTGIDDMSVIVREEALSEPLAVNAVERAIYGLIPPVSVDFHEGLGSLVAAGKGIRSSPGISARVELSLAEAGVDTKFISKGPLERCIIYGVDEKDRDAAVNAVYDRFVR